MPWWPTPETRRLVSSGTPSSSGKVTGCRVTPKSCKRHLRMTYRSSSSRKKCPEKSGRRQTRSPQSATWVSLLAPKCSSGEKPSGHLFKVFKYEQKVWNGAKRLETQNNYKPHKGLFKYVKKSLNKFKNIAPLGSNFTEQVAPRPPGKGFTGEDIRDGIILGRNPFGGNFHSALHHVAVGALHTTIKRKLRTSRGIQPSLSGGVVQA